MKRRAPTVSGGSSVRVILMRVKADAKTVRATALRTSSLAFNSTHQLERRPS
jgi:hypothetical protein